MPKIIRIKAPNGSWYEVCSMYDDTIERIYPSLWFGAYKFFLLTQMAGYPDFIAKEMSMGELEKWVQKPCPDFLLALYDTINKKEQEKLLRGKIVTPADLICWILQGGRVGGMLSQYSHDAGMPENLKGRTPALIDITDSEHIISVGKTDLSDAALKHIVEHQSKVMSQFMDFPDGRWYCFFRTHRGMAGRESGNHGQHLHFISSAYGLDRNLLAKEFKKGKCPKNGFHVQIKGLWR